MPSPSQRFQERMNILQRVYILELPAKVDELEKWFAAFQNTPKDIEALKTLQRLVHNLAGSGATFGFPVVSEKAVRLNTFLKSVLGAPSQLPKTDLRYISTLLDDLKQISIENLPPTSRPWSEPTAPHSPQWWAREGGRRIYLVEEDPHLGKELSVQLGYFGYTVKTFRSLQEIEAAMSQNLPDAIIADIGPGKKDLTAPKDLLEVRRHLGSQASLLPVVFISVRDDLEVRLATVRAGGSAYFAKPVDAASLADTLDDLTALPDPEPFRILIVEDDPAQAARYSAILENAEFVTASINDPMRVMEPLVEFKPDLILIDIFMPSCTGMELATVIRQQDAYVGIPIVFCSVETDLSKQFEALLSGGDDFLTKPIQPERLIPLVTSRARRGRILRSRIVYDGLTGLLNHSNIKMRLNLEVARARRHTERLSYAILDIDQFKAINDNYGHSAGDRVIRTVARLLRQRLRKTDITGRYGGDEFVAILIDADAASAVKILDEIRNSFSKIRFKTPEADFSVTMSCGIASFPEYGDAESLHAVSDKALFKAKAKGGDRIILAGERTTPSLPEKNPHPSHKVIKTPVPHL